MTVHNWAKLVVGDSIVWKDNDEDYFIGVVKENILHNKVVSLKLQVTLGFGYFGRKEGLEFLASKDVDSEHVGTIRLYKKALLGV